MKEEGVADLSFGKVSCSPVDAGFEEVDFGKDHLVVEAFEFGEEAINECERWLVLTDVELAII